MRDKTPHGLYQIVQAVCSAECYLGFTLTGLGFGAGVRIVGGPLPSCPVSTGNEKLPAGSVSPLEASVPSAAWPRVCSSLLPTPAGLHAPAAASELSAIAVSDLGLLLPAALLLSCGALDGSRKRLLL